MSRLDPFKRLGDGCGSAPVARGAAAPLDKMGSKVSPEAAEKAAVRRAERRRMRDAAGKLLSQEAVARCRKYTGRMVSVPTGFGSPLMQGPHGSYFGNVVTCKSVWHCAVCAAYIAEERRQEVAAVVAALQAVGGNVFMLTLTQGHSGFHEPRPLRQAVTRRWRKVLAGKAWQAVRDSAHVVGFCRALEVTHGKHGWHPHLHVLIFFGPEADSRAIGRAYCWLVSRWVRYARADGFECSENAQNVRDVTVSDAAGDYVSKFGVDWEITHAHLKKGRGGRAPFQILADYVRDGRTKDGELFKQYGLAFKGARQLTWSGKVRTMFPRAHDQAETAVFRNSAATPLCILDEHTMREIDARGIGELVLDAADEFGFEGVIWALQSNSLWISGIFPASRSTLQVP